MSTKTTPQQGRRTPLSLSGAVKTPSSGKGGSGTANGHQLSPTSKSQQKVDQQQHHHYHHQQQQQQLINTATNTEEIKDNVPTQITTRKQSSNCSNAESTGNRKREKTPNYAGNSKSQTACTTSDNKVQSPQQLSQLQTNKNDNKLKEVKLMKVDKEEKSKNEKVDKNNDKPNDKKEEEKSQKVVDVSAEPSSNIKSSTKEGAIKATTKELPQENSATELSQKSIVGAEIPTTPKKVKEDRKCAVLIKTSPKIASTIRTSQKTETVLCQEQKDTSTTEAKISNNVDIITESMDVDAHVTKYSPSKLHQIEEVKQASLSSGAAPVPGKRISLKSNVISRTVEASAKSEIQLAIQSDYKMERPRNLNQISGRRSIRPITEYTPSKFQNFQYRESYRQINQELESTFSSMDVTVGSEIHDNSSFSFFGRGRKRERPASSQAISHEVSPPKKARIDFCSVVFSPITMLRNRFSKASLQSSTPVKVNAKSQVTAAKKAESDVEVQNVSGIFMQEDLSTSEDTKVLNDGDSINENDYKDGVTLGEEAIVEKFKVAANSEAKDVNDIVGIEQSNSFEYQHQQKHQDEDSDIEVKESPLYTTTDTSTDGAIVKNRRCVVM